MRSTLRFLCLALALIAGPLQAQERLALVIGNSVYGSIASLDNPRNDAMLMAETLEQVGFKVTMLIDSTQAEMNRGISRFGRDLREAGTEATGLFFYAGHGVQSFGTNYLLPVDIELSDAADLDLVAIEAQSVLRQMYSARNKTNIVMLDACRNNPFTSIVDFNDNGLAEMSAPTGTFLSYATAPGGVALDGLDGNSPFTKAIAGQMPEPGLPIEQMFKRVRVEVIEETGGRQTPWDTSSLTIDFKFVQATPMSTAELEELQLWNSVQASGDPVQIMLFLRAYPDGAFSENARKLLAVLMERELTDPGSVEPAPTVQGPSEAERKSFETAQADASIAGYEAYIRAYPDGVFAEFAIQELAALRQKSETAPAGGEPAQVTRVLPKPETDEPDGHVTFNSPLVSELPEISGRSIADIIKMSPMFPPVEGLPDSYWKDQSCANCHQWNQKILCDQANAYLSLNRQRSLDKNHPFGGALKRSLRNWAAGGCQ